MNKLVILIGLTISVIIILSVALYITGYAYEDLSSGLLSTVSNSRTMQMANLGIHINESPLPTDKHIQEIVMSDRLRLQIDGAVIAVYDGDIFPIWYSDVDREYLTYMDLGSVKGVMDGVLADGQSEVFIKALMNKKESVGDPFILKCKTGIDFLMTWVHIPTPNREVKYIYIMFQNTAEITRADNIEDYRDKYTVLFAGGIFAAACLAIFIPLMLQTCKEK